MSFPESDYCQTKKDKIENKKEDKKDVHLLPNLKTNTETSSYFYISKFNNKDLSYEEKLPKNFKDLDHLLRKILISLEENESVFLNQAKAVLDRDLLLINWRLRLKNLQNNLCERKRDFERIDQTVQCIFKLSSHIDDILVKLEKEIPGSSMISNAFQYTPARMCLYDNIMKINIKQKDIMQQLTNTVLTINEAIDCNPLDPVEQFTKILSLHAEILFTIEKRMSVIEEQLKAVKNLQKFYASTKNAMCNYYLA